MTKPTAPKLTDTQRVLLSTAAQREDGALLPLPKSVKAKGAALAKVIATLGKRGFIEERAAAADAPHWRRDGDGGLLGLFLTAAGRESLEAQTRPMEGSRSPEATKAAKAKNPQPGRAKRKPAAPKPARPRDNSKQDLVLQMLRRHSGVSIADIAAKTGWQAHTVRGFLSAVVRKRLGLPLTSDTAKAGMRRYRIPTPGSADNVA